MFEMISKMISELWIVCVRVCQRLSYLNAEKRNWIGPIYPNGRC